MRRLTGIALLLLGATMLPGGSARAEQPLKQNNYQTVNNAFRPGERLTYNISWSRIVDAGIAVMEVKNGDLVDDHTPTYRLTSTTHSVGLVEAVYPVRDTVESIVDAETLASLAFDLQELHGKHKRRRSMIFDVKQGTVVSRLNNDPPETTRIPPHVEDALAALYYMRTRDDYVPGKQMIVDVNDSGKNWAVEIHVMGREKITTPAGTFSTIKVRTFPKYEGVFMHTGEIYIWVTDDRRKIPVTMKSTISIGSIVATLTKMEGVSSVQ
ncbi:MAG TPA: DUF3108 domain-containing protein [Nitrospirota bacterium]|nr:DUF3108 domain-containing protein [Nitrospirota bacterium]